MMRSRRFIMAGLAFAFITFLFLARPREGSGYFGKLLDDRPVAPGGRKSKVDVPNPNPKPVYIPEPTWTPPPIQDPFPALATSTPPPIPVWNKPKPNLHKTYGLDYAPPLFVGFTRTWPLLLQAVVSYITAGWPPEQIYVIENTGVQRANLDGKLSLQNPFYLNHGQLKKLGVNVIRAPVLMNFAQLQNFYVHLAHENSWPYYFWSHMDVLALSFEDGFEDGPKATEKGYKTVYELCVQELGRVSQSDEKWADKFFAYDHLTLVNRAAYDDIGGWDTFIPFYMTDCDMHSRLLMNNYTQLEARAGIITDTSTVLDNLLALYRVEGIEPTFTDPNPEPPAEEPKAKRDVPTESDDTKQGKPDGLEPWRKLQQSADTMFHVKHGGRDRNTWQKGQHGGQGEPYYYPARGVAEGIDVLTEAGREVYRRKWGHRDCDLISGAGLQDGDQWLVEKDWR